MVIPDMIAPGDTVTLRDAFDACQFRSLLGTGGDTNEMMSRLGCAIAVFGGAPEPLASEMMENAVAQIAAGRVVLLLSDRADLRDYAKREILAMAGRPEGRA